MNRDHRIITIKIEHDAALYQPVHGSGEMQRTGEVQRVVQTIRVIATCPEIATAWALKENPFRFVNGTATVVGVEKIHAVLETHTY